MIFQYLTEDIYYINSKNLKGKKGDRVYIYESTLNMRLVVNENGKKFWVNEKQLTNDKNIR
jgi:hypothetical protein